MSSEQKYQIAVLTTEGIVQKYIAYISNIDEKVLWPDGITPSHPLNEFKTVTGKHYQLNLGIVEKGWILDDTAVRSKIFREALANAVNMAITIAITIYKLRIDDAGVPDHIKESRLRCDPHTTTLVAYVPSKKEEIRDMPLRIGFIISEVPGNPPPSA
jgi:hypothetical protein